MKRTLLFLFVFSFTLSNDLIFGQEKEDNPIYKSTFDWLKNPVPAADSEATTEKEMKPYEETIPGTGQKFKMIPIPGGKFTMGGTRDEEETEEYRNRKLVNFGKNTPTFEVEIKPFWIEEHEVTWKEFSEYGLKWLRDRKGVEKDARAENADAFAYPTNPWDISSISYSNSGRDNYPASGMTAYAAAAYCKWLTLKTGRYYRLPTEAEWEYACRAGSKGAFSFGDDPDELEEYAWYFDSTLDNPEPGYCKVKTKKPNKYGLYDMHGNVSEWVISQYSSDSYEKLKKGDFPKMFIPFKGEFGAVARGGSCDEEAEECRSDSRRVMNTLWKLQDPQIPRSIWWVTDAPFVGFRIVRPLEPPKTQEEAALYEPDPETWKEYAELNTRDSG